MENGISVTLSLLNRTMQVVISSKGLAYGILSREDKRGKVYHTRDGRRHPDYETARDHAKGLIDRDRAKRQQVKRGKVNGTKKSFG